MNNAPVHSISAVHGMSWIVVNTLFSRGIVFISQIFLGYLLEPRDFGIYALALSMTNIMGGVRNGGTAQIMVTQGRRYKDTLSSTTQYAFICNFIAFLVLLVVAPLADTVSKVSDTGWVIVAIALSFPLGTLATIFRTELSIHGRFKEVALLGLVSTGLWQAEVITLALLGFRAYSFAIPMILQSIVDGLLGWLYVREWPLKRGLITWPEFVRHFRETRLIMLGIVMLSLGLTGHYFAAGLFTDPETVGIFFFGFQLAYTFFVIINNGIETVLPPILVDLQADSVRQRKTIVDLLEILLFISAFIAGAALLSAHTVIHLVWNGRWDRSANVVSIMVLSVPAWVGIAIFRAILEARGLWGDRLALLSVYGVGTFGVVAAAAWTKNLNVIAGCLSMFYITLHVASLYFLPTLIGIPFFSILKSFLKPVFVIALCVTFALGFSVTLTSSSEPVQRCIIALITFGILTSCSAWLFFGELLKPALVKCYPRPTTPS